MLPGLWEGGLGGAQGISEAAAEQWRLLSQSPGSEPGHWSGRPLPLPGRLPWPLMGHRLGMTSQQKRPLREAYFRRWLFVLGPKFLADLARYCCELTCMSTCPSLS